MDDMSMKRMNVWLLALGMMLTVVGCGQKRATESVEFERAADAVKKMTAGWNLGNTLDAFNIDLAPGSPTDA
jgi:hypothetical protein